MTKRPATKNSLTSPERSARADALKAFLEKLPGAATEQVFAPRGGVILSLMFKVMGKVFAVLALRGDEYVVLKCDPPLAEMLRVQYKGIGHRTHLDPRHWIAVTLDADVPMKEVKRLATASYELVCASLTRKQQVELAVLRIR
jgi:predicted DNA-binding protein (MmcQ/YjbR family)